MIDNKNYSINGSYNINIYAILIGDKNNTGSPDYFINSI